MLRRRGEIDGRRLPFCAIARPRQMAFGAAICDLSVDRKKKLRQKQRRPEGGKPARNR
jgi:hypothetical protein